MLLQVLMHSAIAAESDGGFDIGEVADVTRAKMIHRHPHVFAEAAVDGAAEVVVNWERLKRVEKHDRFSVLDGVPRALPALAFAQGVQKRPARLGFDQLPSVDDAIAAARAALERVAEHAPSTAAAQPRGQDWSDPGPGGGAASGASLEDSVGELLFAVVALAFRAQMPFSAHQFRPSLRARFNERASIKRRSRGRQPTSSAGRWSAWTMRWPPPARCAVAAAGARRTVFEAARQVEPTIDVVRRVSRRRPCRATS